MARSLILDWRANRLVALVTQEGSVVAFSESFTIDNLPSDGNPLEAIQAARDRLVAFVQKSQLRKTATSLLVGREFYELQPITLPPAPETDWPDMISFQAPQVFTTLRDEGVIDYLPIESHPDTGSQLLSAAMSRQVRDALVQLAEVAGLKLQHIYPRPTAAMSAIRDEPNLDSTWILDTQPGEADISLVQGPRLLMTRAARWDASADSAKSGVALERERKRTISAAPKGSTQVARFVVYGTQAELDQYQAQYTGPPESLHCKALDGYRVANATEGIVCVLSAAAIGAASDMLYSRAGLLDFLHPRKRPAPPDQQQRMRQVLLGVVAAGLGAISLFWWQLDIKNQQVLELQRQLQDLKKQAENYKKVEKRVSEIRRWTNSNVNWLSNLDKMTGGLPPADQFQLTNLTVSAMPAGGELILEGQVNAPETLGAMEAALRSDAMRPEGQDRSQDPSRSLPWVFKERVVVDATPIDVKSPLPPASSPPQVQ